MNLVECEDAVRDLIRSQLQRTGDNPQTGDDFLPATMKRYIRRAERRAYYKEIDVDNTRFLETYTLTGAGTVTLALPADFMRVYRLRTSSTSLDYYQEVAYLDLAKNVSKVFAFIGDKIAIKSTLAAGSTIELLYHNKYRQMETNTTSNLHDITLDWLCYDAAIQCMMERGDVNIKWLVEERQRVEDDDMPNIRRSSKFNAMNITEIENYSRTDGYFVTSD